MEPTLSKKPVTYLIHHIVFASLLLDAFIDFNVNLGLTFPDYIVHIHLFKQFLCGLLL